MEDLREDHDDGTVARVAAIDIAKASGMVCLRVPYDTIEGRRTQQVWNVASTTNAILELGDRLPSRTSIFLSASSTDASSSGPSPLPHSSSGCARDRGEKALGTVPS
ncbi:hypothetical protein ACFV2U_47085 [Streptomyces sp. NPDC059697]|uniref:hypothetical protein n=1 Tax=Streptomyces sp. NPDC059697 TaxID=3346912 RepID=UPI00367C54F9